MDFKKAGLCAALCMSLALPAQGAEYRREGWPLPAMARYSIHGYYSECRDGDGEKETFVDVFKDNEGNSVNRYRTRLRNGGKGGFVWAYESKDGAFVDSQCIRVFDMKYEPGEEFPMPVCAKDK